jgi:hypothetical protein
MDLIQGVLIGANGHARGATEIYKEIIDPLFSQLSTLRSELSAAQAQAKALSAIKKGLETSLTEALEENKKLNEASIDIDAALKLRGFFGKNDASHFEHWAYSYFDRIVKKLKQNSKS